MASSVVKQELPPKGGYPPIEYARNLPKRGPSGMMMFIGGAAVMAFGFLCLKALKENEEMEALIMKDVPGWTVGESVYNTEKWITPVPLQVKKL
ncbi:PREDICTED: NADH dehydrogenase [ubiquinone] 1 alpha subcomplex subunit 13-like [Acropora digitifera]|uniref:NADH dehydrogenase [ubiquinone] 1 alpha subcomplex subunit 13-like n=1 Tax=Acropora digitifera TaxID=70779 RepID=UPI00077AAB96|nr:PREDICTED: NADH dehydrogenase [ubiquinone] 1 alpha subcomplex subunit 13-like [Acropora digitifera]